MTFSEACAIAVPLSIAEARTAGAAAGDQRIAVALHQADAVERDAELFGEHLREGRSVALPIIERAGDDGHRAIGVEAEGSLLGGHRRGGFDVAGDAKPAQFAGALAVALALIEAFDVGAHERVLEQAGEIPAVVDDAGGGLERHLTRLDEIAPPQLEAVDADLRRGEIHLRSMSSAPSGVRHRDRPTPAPCW